MNAKFAVLLGIVVIDSTNKAIRFKEGSTTQTVNVAEGVYFVRGNQGTTDLCAAVVTALEANTNATNPNTYAVTIEFDTEFTNPTAEVTVHRASGTSSFSILWADAATTFVPGLLGFEATNTAHDGNDKVSTLSPTPLWVSNNIINRLEPMPSYEHTTDRSRGQELRGVDRSGEVRDRLWRQLYVHASRMNEESNTDDPSATLGQFIKRQRGAKRFELHEGEIASGSVLDDLDSNGEGTHLGTFVFSDAFYPKRGATFAERRADSPLYSFEALLLKYSTNASDAPSSPVLDGLRSYVRFDDSHAAGRQWLSRASFTHLNGGGDTVKPNVRQTGGVGTPTAGAPLLNGKASLTVATLGSTQPVHVGAYGATADDSCRLTTLYGSTTPALTVQMIAQMPAPGAGATYWWLHYLTSGGIDNGQMTSTLHAAGLVMYGSAGVEGGAGGALRHTYDVPMLVTIRRPAGSNVYSMYFGANPVAVATVTDATAFSATMVALLLAVSGGTNNPMALWCYLTWNRALTDQEAFVDNVAYYTRSDNWEGLVT